MRIRINKAGVTIEDKRKIMYEGEIVEASITFHRPEYKSYEVYIEIPSRAVRDTTSTSMTSTARTILRLLGFRCYSNIGKIGIMITDNAGIEITEKGCSIIWKGKKTKPKSFKKYSIDADEEKFEKMAEGRVSRIGKGNARSIKNGREKIMEYFKRYDKVKERYYEDEKYLYVIMPSAFFRDVAIRIDKSNGKVTTATIDYWTTMRIGKEPVKALSKIEYSSPGLVREYIRVIMRKIPTKKLPKALKEKIIEMW